MFAELSRDPHEFASKAFVFAADPSFGFKDSPMAFDEVVASAALELDVMEEEVVLARLGVFTIEGVRYWIWSLGEVARQGYVAVWETEGETGISVDPQTRLKLYQYLAWKHRSTFYD